MARSLGRTLGLTSFTTWAILTTALRAQAQNEPPAPVPAAETVPAPVATPLPPPPPPPPTATTPELSPITGRLYGFIEERFNATLHEPSGEIGSDGRAIHEPSEVDFSLPAFHVMAQGALYQRFRYYFNLRAQAGTDVDDPTADAGIGIRNAWLETSIAGDYLNVRVGKLYRRFGLYNEILDTVPSYVGVEVPVYVGPLRPMLTRTTNLMVHGKASSGANTLAYAATAGKDEVSPGDDVVSPGFDLNYTYDSKLQLGSSFYTTGGTVTPHVLPGEGPPAGAVAPWMESDRYSVFGGYGRFTLGNFSIHGEAWFSPHRATRDPAKVLQTAKNAENFSSFNRTRMGVTGTEPTEATVARDIKYEYSAVNVRAAYTFEVGGEESPMELTPFINWEYARNLESIADENYGGDGEAGHSPRGIVIHNRVGAVFKPVPAVALKTEATYAMYKYPNRFESTPEIWLSLSYAWELVNK